MLRITCQVSLIAVVSLALAGPTSAATYTIGAALEDYEAYRQVDTGNYAISNGASGYLRIGSRTTGASGTAASAIFPFALPALGPDEIITGATLSVMSEVMSANFPVANIDLYGLPLDPAPVTQAGEWYYSGPQDPTPGVTKLQDNFLLPSDMNDTRTRFVSTDISSYIQSLYAAGAVEGDFATLRLSYDQVENLASHNRYQIRSRQASASVENPEEQWPLLIITTEVIPEPGALGLLGLALGLTGLRRRGPR
jgi:hypothetical protein